MTAATTGSIFLLFAAVVGLAAGAPAAFADHAEITIEPVNGSGVPGCEETEMGCYDPDPVTVDVGSVIIFSNTDTVAHTFTSGTPDGGPDGIFDSGLSIAGSSFEYKTEQAGEIKHFCIVHPWMMGTIIVQDDDDHDDHGHDEDSDKGSDADAMMADMIMDDPTATGMLSDGTVVSVWSKQPMAGEPLYFQVAFEDEYVNNYDLMVTQNGKTIMDETGHTYDASDPHAEMTMPLSSSDPVDITITFQGYANRDDMGPVGEQVVFTNIVPEFGTIAMIVLAVAVISTIAVTAKSRVIPRL